MPISERGPQEGWSGTGPYQFSLAPAEAGLHLRRGEWRPVVADGKKNARLCCPVCGEIGTLDHEVDAQGKVVPSVQCPKPGCPFHSDPSTLLGWEGAVWP